MLIYSRKSFAHVVVDCSGFSLRKSSNEMKRLSVNERFSCSLDGKCSTEEWEKEWFPVVFNLELIIEEKLRASFYLLQSTTNRRSGEMNFSISEELTNHNRSMKKDLWRCFRISSSRVIDMMTIARDLLFSRINSFNLFRGEIALTFVETSLSLSRQ